MARLIDADALIEKLKRASIFEKITNAEDKNVFEIIAEQPTDYDVERVVRKLEGRYEVAKRELTIYLSKDIWANAIDIVKAGGINE